MTENVLAENLTTDIEGILEKMCLREPRMRDVLEAFASLARERRNLSIDTTGRPPGELFDAKAFGSGRPLLAGRELSGLDRSFADAAKSLLSVIEHAFPNIGPHAKSLRSELTKHPEQSALILEAAFSQDPQAMQARAEALGIPVATLSFLVLEILKACLGKAREHMAHLADDGLWCKGYCPVCGAAPDFGILKEKRDPSEFLISKAGRLWLHCSLCGHIWRFVRLVCPSCGEKDHEKLEILTVQGREHERIHACLSCNRYVLVIDLVESKEKLHPELAPLGLIHLDILAQEKGYLPLAKTAWNGLHGESGQSSAAEPVLNQGDLAQD